MLLHSRQQLFVGGAWICGAFEGNNLSLTKMRNKSIGRVDNKAKIRLPVLVERRRDANNQGIRFLRQREIGRRNKAILNRLLNGGRWNMFDVATARIQCV